MSNGVTKTDYKERDKEEKIRALAVLEKQYPELSELRPLLRTDPNQFRMMYPVVLIEAVSKALKIPLAGVDVLGGKPYINKTGLTFKIQNDPRRVKMIKAVPVLYAVKIGLINVPQDKDFQKYFVGYSEDGTTVYHGIVEFEDGSRFEDEGSANAKYLNKQWNKMSTMVPYIHELASTRATNRAMRLASGIGLVSTEELNERGYTLIKENISKEVTGKKTHIIEEIEKLFKKLKFNEAKRIMHCNKYGGVSDLMMMTEANLGSLAVALRMSQPKKGITKKTSKKKAVKKLPSPKKEVESGKKESKKKVGNKSA